MKVEQPNSFYWRLSIEDRKLIAENIDREYIYLCRYILPQKDKPKRILRPDSFKALNTQLVDRGWDGNMIKLFMYMYDVDEEAINQTELKYEQGIQEEFGFDD
ncbi:MAG: hypothetical protein JAZ11_13945 [Candidatus Thiodiazotropha lotti]|nr:hypothetical protein [Candidatus Thiodiazotropha lotti]